MSNRPIDPSLPEPEPGDPSFETFDEIFFAVYAEGGEDLLRQLLAGLNDLDAETLEDAASALQRAGKLKAANVVLEVANERPSQLDAILSEFPKGHIYRLIGRNNWLYKRSKITGEPLEALRSRYTQK
jgi:hypothetical protein